MAFSDGHGLFVLSSNNSLDVFPGNTATNFSNVLPRKLQARGQRKYYVRLVGVALSNEADNLSHVRVHLQELQPQKAGQKFTQVLGSFQFPTEEVMGSDGYGFHTFRHHVYLPLQFEELESLQVRLTDENDTPLNLHQNFSTLIWIEMYETVMEDRFTIACSSRQPALYPANELGSYFVPLPSELNLPGYEVALLNVLYPPQMEDQQDEVSLLLGEKHETEYLRFYLDNYSNSDDFLRHVQERIRNTLYRDALAIHKVNDGKYKDSIVIVHSAVTSVFNQIRVAPSPAFSRACGQINSPVEPKVLKKGELLVFEGVLNIFLAKPHPFAMVECDIIEASVKSGKHANLIQIVPLLRSQVEGRSKLYEPERLIYHPVVQRPISRIAFNFRDPSGRQKYLRTANDEDFVLITLSFRKMK